MKTNFYLFALLPFLVAGCIINSDPTKITRIDVEDAKWAEPYNSGNTLYFTNHRGGICTMSNISSVTTVERIGSYSDVLAKEEKLEVLIKLNGMVESYCSLVVHGSGQKYLMFQDLTTYLNEFQYPIQNTEYIKYYEILSVNDSLYTGVIKRINSSIDSRVKSLFCTKKDGVIRFEYANEVWERYYPEE